MAKFNYSVELTSDLGVSVYSSFRLRRDAVRCLNSLANTYLFQHLSNGLPATGFDGVVRKLADSSISYRFQF